MSLRELTNKIYVVAFVRSVNDGEIYENVFCCNELPETNEGQNIFNECSSCLEIKDLSRENYVGIYTDVPHQCSTPLEFFLSCKK
jgi:hypothetical protein